LKKLFWREIVSPASAKPLRELELVFSSGKQEGVCRFLVSGFDLEALPRLPMADYPKGLYMPMGIGVPPFFQSYDDLQKQPPHQSPMSACCSTATRNGSITTASVSMVLFCTATKRSQTFLHIYLLSYERHSLIAHFTVSTPAP